ncbi:Glycine cleavage system protein H [Oopsacas minuta]|uniref:Glycine cleavage system H protein n=1 Tax=Oopsacas minuta TaxID=111878 RepID=A0AAV7JKE3_9METZ|nr:Glycine cleavage system protein H [Oopsacas minuta]
MYLNKIARPPILFQCLRNPKPLAQIKLPSSHFTQRRPFAIEIPQKLKAPKNTKFTKTSEWVLRSENDKNTVTIGITNYAQVQLGDLVYAELVDKGSNLKKGDVLCLLESVKAASEVYLPFPGEVLEANKLVEEKPETINKSPYEDGWIIKLKISEDESMTDLMSEDQYEEFLDKN